MNTEMRILDRDIEREHKFAEACYRAGDTTLASFHQEKYYALRTQKRRIEWTANFTPPTNLWKQEYAAAVLDPYDSSWKKGLNTLIEEPPRVSKTLLGVLTELI